MFSGLYCLTEFQTGYIPVLSKVDYPITELVLEYSANLNPVDSLSLLTRLRKMLMHLFFHFHLPLKGPKGSNVK